MPFIHCLNRNYIILYSSHRVIVVEQTDALDGTNPVV